MLTQTVDRLQTKTDLHKALKQQEFVLHYQPFVDTFTGSIRGCEALIRWQHPRQGLLSPGEFITVAEENRLIVDIGWWVMETACAQMQQWHRQFSNNQQVPLTIGINVSAKQFFESDCVHKIEKILTTTGINPQQVKLEMTESLLIEADILTKQKLQKIRALGLQLSVDDFGTGYSSLSYLHQFPLTGLKVDRSFLQQVPEDAQRTAIAEAIILLGQKLNLTVIAEGIETEAQLAWVRANKVPLVQGKLLSSGLPSNSFMALLQTGSTASSYF